MVKSEKFSISGTFITLALVFFSLLCLLPFYYVIVVSFSDPMQVREGQVILFPKGFSTQAYEIIFTRSNFFNSFKISVLRTVIGTALSLALECAMAYALSKRYMRGRKVLVLMVVFTMLFHGGMIPTYLIVRYTGLINTIWALIIPNAIGVMNILILISFFSSIPESIEESAKIDGANDLIIWLKLILPLSMPAIATIALFNAVGHWNSLMDGVIYINKESLKPLQVFLVDIVMKTRVQEMMADSQSLPTLSMQTAVIFAATLPIILVYPYLQKHFVKGVMVGAIKG